jgi:hypothetical protein
MSASAANVSGSTPVRTVEVNEVWASSIKAPTFRLDAAHYRNQFAEAATRALSTGLPVRKVRDMADAFVPGRTKLITVKSAEAGAPYLRAHDAFEIRVNSDRYVAKSRVRNYEELCLKKGMILTPSSGRNLGPMAYVGSYLNRFAMTDVMRIVPNSEDEGFYLLGYLLTPTAQALIRRGRSGTTVDHLSPDEVLAIDVPWIEDKALREDLIAQVRSAEAKMDEGRMGLDFAAARLHAEAGISSEPPVGGYLSRKCGDAFGVSVRDVGLRLDAAFHDPTVNRAAEILKSRGGVTLVTVAKPVMLGRYKRFYVEAPHGRPIMSGRQILQARQVNLKRISDRSFKDPEAFVLKTGTTIFTCDGRSEEALGEPGYVMPIWDGWMASNHVMRLIAEPDVSSGYLYLAIASPWVQIQLKAIASGSVVDAIEPDSVSKIVIPMLGRNAMLALGAEAARCWNLISESIALLDATVERFERSLHQSPNTKSLRP